MRPDLERPPIVSMPLVGTVPGLDGVPATPERDRDEAILGFLRQRLWERARGIQREAGSQQQRGEADKYEPQRLSRKILWQYDASARKVPLLRRPYI